MQITISNLFKSYKRGFNALSNINIELHSPSMIGLVGPNGAGKTTLMKLLVSQLVPTQGSITVDGIELQKNEKYLKRRLGYLPQEFGLYEELTVFQFLDYMASLKEIRHDKEAVIKRCILMTNLEDKQDLKIKTLSGGQKQRVGIAQALLNDPELFIVDEPTVGLDPEERIKFRNLFSKNASSKLVVLSTHIIDDVESICNKLIVMNKGSILFDGTPGELIELAGGHVAKVQVANEKEELIERNFKITSRVVVPNGLCYRIVGDNLPAYSEYITPSLEDAYIYCIMKGDMA